jgi:hypothetical protein
MNIFVERHAEKTNGALLCFDRVLITRTMVDIAYAETMTRCLYPRKIRIFDHAQ